MEITELFGRRIRRLREAQRLTQQQLGEKAVLSYKYLGAIERGEENPSLKIVSSIASGLGVALRDLFEFEHEETSPAKLRKKLDGLLKDADITTLQQAVKLIRAMLI
jgi:transcriptional regulator with XRE-family HTH domain